jgi:hypothetical protein
VAAGVAASASRGAAALDEVLGGDFRITIVRCYRIWAMAFRFGDEIEQWMNQLG